MDYPTFVTIDGKEYDINIDYMVALECLKLINNPEIDDLERAIGIITMLFGEECPINEIALEKAKKYLECGNSNTNNKNAKIDIDLEQDIKYIRSSFMSDYGINLENTDLHWYSFFEKIESFTQNAIMNRIRDLRNYDLSEIKDFKTRKKIKEAQENLSIKPKIINKKATEKQKEDFLKKLKK